MSATFAIGIDIGGTTTKMGLTDKEGKILMQAVLPTVGKTVEEFIEAVKAQAEAFISKAGRYNIQGIGVGAPNGNFYTGEIVDAANLPWKGIIPFAQMLGKALDLPVTLTNDANATAIGEMMYGAARGMRDFLMVTLGTGVGSGFVANGQLIYGHDGFAGELGHVTAIREGRLCGCGKRGCMERYCSATGIAITANEWLEQRNDASVLREYTRPITAKEIQEAADVGDKLALEIFDYTGMILGETLANAVAITSPQAIIFFGGLAKAGPLLAVPAKKYMEANLLNVFRNKVDILQSSLPDSDAAILGASALACESS